MISAASAGRDWGRLCGEGREEGGDEAVQGWTEGAEFRGAGPDFFAG